VVLTVADLIQTFYREIRMGEWLWCTARRANRVDPRQVLRAE
jgi:hypothetical protein